MKIWAANNLSKRSFVHSMVGYVRNSTNAKFSLEALPRDATSNTSPPTGESQTGSYVGTLH